MNSKGNGTNVAIEESKVLGDLGQRGGALLVEGFDDESRLTRSEIVPGRLAVNETLHSRNRVVVRVVGLENLVVGTSEVVVRIVEGNLALVRRSTDRVRLAIDCPVRVTVWVAEGLREMNQVIDIRMKIPVPSNVVEGVVLHHEVDNVFDLQ